MDGGSTRREHLMVVAAAGAIVPELEVPPLPPCLAYVLGWFIELSAARSSSGFGVGAIGYADIAAWSVLTGICPTPWEVALIRRLDAAFLKIISDAEPGRLHKH